MPRRRDNDWEWYPPSRPLAVEGGIATSKQRGQMAESWWSQRFVAVLESYGLGGRMQRGRRYARTGQVVSLDIAPGTISAKVQGSRPTPYTVKISLAVPTRAQWTRIEAAMAGKVAFLAKLLDGEVPAELEAVFADAGVSLLPSTWRDVRTTCNCPDWGDPCKHTAAVLYVFADKLDSDPWQLLTWRGRTREELLGGLPTRPTAAADEIAVWWPFPPGALPDSAPASLRSSEQLLDPERPDAVLDQLDDLDVTVGAEPVTALLRRAYEALRADG
jgi:uncharacterized Zn finger protein